MKEIVCITCPNSCRIRCEQTQGGYVFTGNRCPRGAEYAKSELTAPVRSVTSTVRTAFSDAPVVSVRSIGPVPKARMREAVQALRNVTVTERLPLGSVVLSNVLGLGVDFILTTDRLTNP